LTLTTVHLVRHGEVDNPGGVLYGRLPGFRLSPAGEAMAVLAAEALRGKDVTVVRSSPLERAVQTAEPIAAHFDVTATTDDRLLESANIFEGKTFGVGDGSLRNPAYWKYLTNPFRPSWGEPYIEQVVRMMGALDAARDAARGHEAVCVSHQLPIWVTRCFTEHRRLWHDPRKRQCSLASLTSFTYHGDRMVSIGYSEPARDLLPAHLTGKGRKGDAPVAKSFGA
jgi:broad specificity phosphatase PhoE